MATKVAALKFGLVCTICNSRNYVTTKNKMENKDKLLLKKFCRHCKKHSDHKEVEKLGKN